jgi:hypothetical protein
VGLQHATRRREGEGVRYDMAHGEGGGGVAGDTRSRVAEVVRERRDVGRVWYGMLARGPAQGKWPRGRKKKMGRTQMNSANFN